MNFRNNHRLGALLLAFTLFLCVAAPAGEGLAAPASLVLPEGETEGSYTEEGTWIPSGSSFTNESASKAYIRGAFYPSAAKYTTVLADRLNRENRKLFDSLLVKLSDVAVGKITCTIFEMPYSFRCTLDSVHNSGQEFQGKLKEQIGLIFMALLGDCPSELYWFDKTCGVSWGYRVQYDAEYIWIEEIKLSFYVAKEYSQSNEAKTFYLDAAKAQAIQTAAANAKAIVAANRGKSDIEKLRAYKNEICALTEYNTAAVTNSSTPYGNPWQLVWVFDGNPATNVVCEGYAKAFQYLAERSSFSNDVTVMSMTGDVWQYGSSGRHMWNVVSVNDSKKYHVDVTFCDGTGGSDDFFMAGYDSFDYTGAGKKRFIYKHAGYVYDKEPADLFTDADDDMNGTSYDPATDPTVQSGVCGASVDYSFNNQGRLRISGEGGMYDYSASSPAPWQAFAASVKKITVADKVTKIGTGAFADCVNATTIKLGRGLTFIAEDAVPAAATLEIHSCKDYAYDWAAAHGRKVQLKNPHDLVKVARVEPTYTHAGTEEYWKCSECGRKFSDAAGSNVIAEPTVIPALERPDEATVSGCVYKLNHTKKTAVFTGVKKAGIKNLKIPDEIKAYGQKYKVVEISEKACRKLKNLSSLTIGKNVAKIGKSAFEGCKKLAKITIKTTKLTKNGIGKNCMKGIKAGAVFKVPKAKLALYKKLFVKVGKAPAKSEFTN